MFGRIIAIVLIFIGTSIAWMVLGESISSRTWTADSQIREEVKSLWGTEQKQPAPLVICEWEEKKLIEDRVYSAEPGATTTQHWEYTPHSADIELNSTKARVKLDMDYRRKGLLWYSTYNVGFDARYTWKYTQKFPGTCTVQYTFPSDGAIYNNFIFESNGKLVEEFSPDSGDLKHVFSVQPGQRNTLHVSYQSRGLGQWTYAFRGNQKPNNNEEEQPGGVSRVKNLDFEIKTGFANIDLPVGTISPGKKTRTENGWILKWKYSSLITGFNIGMKMPDRVNPGPLAAQISRLAPVSLLFFFLIIFIVCLMRNIDLHPMNYIFLAAAFFSFHLLLAYLADHVDIKLAFAISAVVSIVLVTSYLRLVVGARFAILEAGGAQLLYLVLFSYAHFLEGFTGLSITIISVLSLFFLMQLTGRVNWSERFKVLPSVKRIQQPPPEAGA